MKDILLKILDDFSTIIATENKERSESGALEIQKVKIKVLGQMSLLVNTKIVAVLQPVSTADLDALWSGDRSALQFFKACVEKHNLEYDDDSHLVWIPPESKFDPFYDSDAASCEVIQPIYAILSKAVKAPVKNRVLVRNALAHFGDDLIRLLKKHGAKPEDFLE